MINNEQPTNNRQRAPRHWLALSWRVLRLLWAPAHRTAERVRASYDRIAPGYDQAWTGHMRHLSLEMLARLDPPAGAECIDLATGTGFVAGELARRTGGRVFGVDASSGMLQVARQGCPHGHFVQEDALTYLRRRPAASADVITCAWALGYSRPWAILCESARVLRPGGRIGVIDNSLTSLAEVLWLSVQAFAERPADLSHVMKVRFLPGSAVLAAMMRAAGLGVRRRWDGRMSYHVGGGQEALARLTATGAAAGFEFAAEADEREAVFARFAELIDRRGGGFDVTHRYLAAVGVRP